MFIPNENQSDVFFGTHPYKLLFMRNNNYDSFGEVRWKQLDAGIIIIKVVAFC